MTTISSNRRRRKITPKTGAFLIIVTVLLCAGLLWRDAAANIIWRFLSPALLARTQAAAASTGFFGQFQSNAALAQENAQLKEELASTTALVLDRNYLYAENLQLKEMLGREVSDPSILAAVILSPPGVPYGTLMLDVGTKSGVRSGDLVASEGSAYIGRVSAAYDTASRVVLFSAPGQTYQGYLRGTVPVSVVGEGSGSMEGQVPAGTDVSVGDPVVLPAIMPEFAAAVSAVVAPEGESFQTIYMTMPVNPLELRFAIVHLQQN